MGVYAELQPTLWFQKRRQHEFGRYLLEIESHPDIFQSVLTVLEFSNLTNTQSHRWSASSQSFAEGEALQELTGKQQHQVIVVVIAIITVGPYCHP
jgi:hypothetical protein